MKICSYMQRLIDVNTCSDPRSSSHRLGFVSLGIRKHMTETWRGTKIKHAQARCTATVLAAAPPPLHHPTQDCNPSLKKLSLVTTTFQQLPSPESQMGNPQVYSQKS